MNISNLPEKAAAVIDEEFSLISGVDELSEMLGVTNCHIVRCFKKSLGITPGRYLAERRLYAAKLILAYRDYSVETVAQMVGYSGANYFCKVFRRFTGETPAAFRKTHSATDFPALSVKDSAFLEELDRQSYI